MCQPPPPATALHVPLDRLLHRTCFATREGARAALAAGRVRRADQVRRRAQLRLSLAEASAISLLLDGAPLPAAPPSLTVALHKPRGIVTTCADEELAPSGKTYPGIRTLLSAPHRALAPIGRLDADSEGLLLLTNDGALSAAICQSASCVKRYLVRIAPRRRLLRAERRVRGGGGNAAAGGRRHWAGETGPLRARATGDGGGGGSGGALVR